MVAGATLSTVGGYAQISSEQANLPFEKETQTRQIIGLYSDSRDAGDPIITDDFSVPDNWLIYSKVGTDPEWQIVTEEPPALDGFISDMASTTKANGFGVFDGIQYLRDEIVGVPEQDAYLEYGSTINRTGLPGVILEFEQAYRAFNRDQTFVEVTATTWDDGEFVSYELNSGESTNGPRLQETATLNISEIAAGESSVKI